MQLIWISLITLALSSNFGSVVATESTPIAHKGSIRERCAGGKVLNTTTVHAAGRELKVTTRSCPPSSEDTALPLAARTASPQKRQLNVCSQACTVSCDVITKNAPFISDCDQLTDALEALSPQTFLAPAMTFKSWEYLSCGVGFGNLQTFAMDYCYLQLGFDLGLISSKCFPSFDGPTVSSDGFCFPSPATWGVEGYLV